MSVSELLWRSVCECVYVCVHVCVCVEGGRERVNLMNNHATLYFAVMNQFIQKLDSRYEKARKPGTGSTVKRERVNGLPSTSNPPPNLPSWMIDPSYKMPATTSVCISPPSMEGQEPPTGIMSQCGLMTLTIVHSVQVSDVFLPAS